MIIIICGKPRVGKTALNTCFAIWEMQSNGSVRLKRSIEKIKSLSGGNCPLTLPTIPPIYTNYDARFHIGYKKYIEPYRVNPLYIGLPNDDMPTMPIAPYGELHITEGQNYWNSRESATFPRYISKWFETHGHFHLDIYIDVQRAKLIDLNVRKLANKIIEVQRMVHIKDVYGRILRTVWYCKEFSDTAEYEIYDNGGNGSYTVTKYVYEGNIFENYNSHSCELEFMPTQGKDFLYLKSLNGSEIAKLPESERIFYSTETPKELRARLQKGEDNGKNGK